jgi:hypothetical protein
MANRIIYPTAQSTKDKWKADFMEWAPKNGVPVEWFGRPLKLRNQQEWRIVGWDARAKKYAVIAERRGEITRIAFFVIQRAMEMERLKNNQLTLRDRLNQKRNQA